jgi:hypothetical protein
MNRIGLDPFNIDQKFLGDAYMEYEMLKRSLEQISYFQHTYFSEEEIQDFINSLYQTITPELQNELGLEFGKVPTDEQLSMLPYDILWYVEEEITLPNKIPQTDANGNLMKDNRGNTLYVNETMTVLIPQIFFAKDTIENINDFNNIGTMLAGNNVNIDVDNLTNTNNSSIVANNDLTIIATNDVNNFNGGVIANTGMNLNNTNNTNNTNTTNNRPSAKQYFQAFLLTLGR